MSHLDHCVSGVLRVLADLRSSLQFPCIERGFCVMLGCERHSTFFSIFSLCRDALIKNAVNSQRTPIH